MAKSKVARSTSANANLRGVANLAYWTAVQAGVPSVALGSPGMGKTQSMYAFAKATNRKLYVFIPSTRDPTDICGCPFPSEVSIPGVNGNREVAVTRIGSPEWAVQFLNGDNWIIYLDELTTAMLIMQSAMLRVIAERVVGEIHLPASTWIAGAANRPETTPGAIPLSSPMSNRLYHHNWATDRRVVIDGFAAGLQFAAPRFTPLPEDWQDGIPVVAAMVAAFHQYIPNMLDAEPTDADGQSKPWPSQRTWELSVRALAAAQSFGAGRLVEHELLAGLVGKAASSEYFTWLDNLDLPDPEQALQRAMADVEAGRRSKPWLQLRPDQVIALIGRVTQLVASEPTAPRWYGAMYLVDLISEDQKNLALGVVRALVDMGAPGGVLSGRVSIPDAFVERIYPYIQRITR